MSALPSNRATNKGGENGKRQSANKVPSVRAALHAAEVTHVEGLHHGEVVSVRLTPEGSPAANYAFDVTPARLVTGLITERGICQASEDSILALYPEHQPS